jgi:hypothetical protein
LETLVEELDVAIEGCNPVSVGPVRYCGCEGGSFGLKASAPQHCSQLPRALLVDFDLQRMSLLPLWRAGIDGPSLAPLSAPIPGEILDVAAGASSTTTSFPTSNASNAAR